MGRVAAFAAFFVTLLCAAPQVVGEEGATASRHGFRYDPMRYVNESRTVQTALVRRHVFREPQAGDAAILKQRIDEVLADWGEVPFEGGCSGLAWDGKQLWALDRKGKRICVIERAKP